MNQPNCDVCNGSSIYGVQPQIVESGMWRVELNPNQQHLGRVFVGLRQHKSSVSDLTEQEFVELHRIMIKLEGGMRGAFNPDVINWMALMNNAVRDGQQTHIHWHMVPRYSQPVTFNGHVYTDDAYPRQYNTAGSAPYLPDADEALAIVERIRKYL